MIASSQLHIKFIEHDVAQKRTQRTALGSTFRTHLKQASVYYATAEIFVYQAYYPSVFYGSAEYFYQPAMTYRIKEAFNVKVDYIFIACTYIFCALRRASWHPLLGRNP